MKNKFLYTILLAFALLSNMIARATQLSGTYTIDQGAPASLTNFQNFASAITYMTSTSIRSDAGPSNSGTLGVSGPVLFQVAAGTYNVTATISVPAINGASPLNTITFDGGNASNRIITGNIPTAGVFLFNLCKYVTLQNLTLINTNTSNCGVVIIYNNTTTGSSASSSPGGSCNKELCGQSSQCWKRYSINMYLCRVYHQWL